MQTGGAGAPPDLNDFRPDGRPAPPAHDFPNDFINDFPPAGRPAQKTYCYNNTNLLPTGGLYPLFLQQQQPAPNRGVIPPIFTS